MQEREANKTLYTPSDETIKKANITRYTHWLEERTGRGFDNYQGLWHWSVENIEAFWESIWQFFEVWSGTPYTSALKERKMPGAEWFTGSTLNYAEHVFRNRYDGDVALYVSDETGKDRTVTWGELRRQTAAVASSLKEAGVGPGDRVAAYLPNSHQAVVACLATVSLGGIWSSCSPDFGGQSVVDRFKQISPKVLVAADGYQYRGKRFDRRDVVEKVRSAIPSIGTTVMVTSSPHGRRVERAADWEDFASGETSLAFRRVPFDHPLWILYSSGTTGLPKPIVHAHGGMLLEHLKALSIHNDLRYGDRMFWYTSTGWMMWNYLVGSLLVGSTAVLYDGDPLFPAAEALWELAERARVRFFGASAAYVAGLAKVRATPRERDLRSLDGFGSTGSALPASGFEWLCENVKQDLWIASISGGTDVCTAFVGGCPTLPVRAGRIQCRYLGAAVESFDDAGKPVIDRMGELVITEPMPSMPLYLWGDDETRERYRESYFSVFPGVWRHGDWIEVASDGSCVIFGRSDATIKRMGVRMGTSEIYSAVESIPDVLDSLIIDMEFLGGRTYMPLFVVLREGKTLDEDIRSRINAKIRNEISPRFVPDEVIQVHDVPRTISGKKLEVPVRRIFLGTEAQKAYNPGSLKDPSSMDFFIDFARKLEAKGRERA